MSGSGALRKGLAEKSVAPSQHVGARDRIIELVIEALEGDQLMFDARRTQSPIHHLRLVDADVDVGCNPIARRMPTPPTEPRASAG